MKILARTNRTRLLGLSPSLLGCGIVRLPFSAPWSRATTNHNAGAIYGQFYSVFNLQKNGSSSIFPWLHSLLLHVGHQLFVPLGGHMSFCLRLHLLLSSSSLFILFIKKNHFFKLMCQFTRVTNVVENVNLSCLKRATFEMLSCSILTR